MCAASRRGVRAGVWGVCTSSAGRRECELVAEAFASQVRGGGRRGGHTRCTCTSHPPPPPLAPPVFLPRPRLNRPTFGSLPPHWLPPHHAAANFSRRAPSRLPAARGRGPTSLVPHLLLPHLRASDPPRPRPAPTPPSPGRGEGELGGPQMGSSSWGTSDVGPRPRAAGSRDGARRLKGVAQPHPPPVGRRRGCLRPVAGGRRR